MRLQQDHEEVVVKMKQQEEVKDGRRIKQQEQPTPALFLCPISLEIMRDPVIVCTGQTYDRGSIDKWIADGHRTCPITMLHLHDLTLIPNIIVRQLIDAWCASDAAASAMFAPYIDQHQHQRHHQHHHLLLDPPPGALQLEQQQQQQQSQSELVVCMLRRIAKGQEVKQSVNRLRALARHGDSGVCGCIIDAGGALLLASILADEMQQDCHLVHHEVEIEDEDEDEERSSCCGEIMSLLAMLCGGDGTAREAIVNAVLSESGALDCVVAHLRVAAARITAAMLLKRLLVTEQIRAALGSAPDFFPALITLISSSPPSSTKSLLKILHRACTHKPNRARAVQHGAIQALTAVLCSPSSSTAVPHGAPRGTERALATLEQLCGVEQGRRAVCECAAAVHCAVRLLVGCSRLATEFATGCLLLVCQSGPVEVLQLAIRAGARRQLLLLLQSDCSGRAKKKALELLKLFHAIFFVQGDEHVSSDFKNVDLY